MANPVWPATLPQTPYLPDNRTPEYDPADNTISTSVTVGPVKRRRRFTAVPETCKLQIWVTSAQLATLKNFVKTTLQDVSPFDWIDFRDGSTASYRFPAGWSSCPHKYDSGDMWTVDMTLELLP